MLDASDVLNAKQIARVIGTFGKLAPAVRIVRMIFDSF